MTMNKTKWGLLGALALGCLPAQAALIDRGNGLLYDDTLDITWLQDANYAKTSGYDADGLMDWTAAKSWADGLVFDGYTDWRLANITDTGTSGCNLADSGTDCGFNAATATSELAHMYFNNLSLKSYRDASGSIQSDWGVFGNGALGGERDFALVQNLQSSVYWSAAEYAPDTSNAWLFITYNGNQNGYNKDLQFYAWAVRDGDVAAPSNVPEPGSMALLGLGGLLALWTRRHRVIG